MNTNWHIECDGNSPENYAKAAKAQKQFVRDIADRLAAGKPLDDEEERIFAAGILRAWADNLSESPKRKRGTPRRKFSGNNVALLYAVRTKGGEAKSRVISALAESHNVSDEAIRKAIEKHLPEVIGFVGMVKLKKVSRQPNPRIGS